MVSSSRLSLNPIQSFARAASIGFRQPASYRHQVAGSLNRLTQDQVVFSGHQQTNIAQSKSLTFAGQSRFSPEAEATLRGLIRGFQDESRDQDWVGQGYNRAVQVFEDPLFNKIDKFNRGWPDTLSTICHGLSLPADEHQLEDVLRILRKNPHIGNDKVRAILKQLKVPMHLWSTEKINEIIRTLDSPQIRERVKLHSELVNKVYQSYLDTIKRKPHPTSPQPVAHIVTGTLGAGKSSLIEQLVKQDHTLLVDSDVFKPQFREYNVTEADLKNAVPDARFTPEDLKALHERGIDLTVKGLGSTAVNHECRDLFDNLLQKAWDAHAKGQPDNLVITYAGTDIESDLKLIQTLKEKGYKIYLHHIETPPSIAIDRTIDRFYGPDGRYTPPNKVAVIGTSPTANFIQLLTGCMSGPLVDGYTWWRNDGQAPALLGQAGCDQYVSDTK